MGRNLRLLVLAASTAVLAAAAASAAPGGSTPSPKLTLTDVVVGAADLGPGTLVLADKTTKLGGVPFLVRVIVTGTAGNPTTLLIFAGIERTADAAYSDYAETRTELGLAGVRKHLASIAAPGFELGKRLFGGKGAGSDLTLEKAIVGRRVALGGTGFRVPLTAVLNKGTIRYDVAFVYTDRVFASLTVIGQRGKRVTPATANSFVVAEQKLLTKVFTVANSTPPTIGGTAQQGQTLTAGAGSWTGSPTSFAYAWSRCDATGAGCAPIAGATAKTYVPTAADSGATLRADVTGSNAVSSAQASSKVTAAVA